MHFSKLCTIWLRFSFHSFACLIFFSYILYERCWREPVNETFIANNCFKAIILHTANQDVESKQKNRGKRSSEKSPDRLAVCNLIRHVLTFIDTWWPLVSVVFINAAKEDVRWWCIKSSKPEALVRLLPVCCDGAVFFWKNVISLVVLIPSFTAKYTLIYSFFVRARLQVMCFAFQKTRIITASFALTR